MSSVLRILVLMIAAVALLIPWVAMCAAALQHSQYGVFVIVALLGYMTYVVLLKMLHNALYPLPPHESAMPPPPKIERHYPEAAQQTYEVQYVEGSSVVRTTVCTDGVMGSFQIAAIKSWIERDPIKHRVQISPTFDLRTWNLAQRQQRTAPAISTRFPRQYLGNAAGLIC